MDKRSPIKPPDFLGKDTSYEQMKKVPYFYLGIPYKRFDYEDKTKVTSFRNKDLSGHSWNG